MRDGWLVGAVAALCLVLSSSPAKASEGKAGPAVEEALITIAAESLETVFSLLAASVRALGNEYLALARTLPPAGQADKNRWLASRTVQGPAAIYRTWPGDPGSPPAAGTGIPAFLSFTGESLSDAAIRQFEIFSALTPVIRAAHSTFDLSWVYLTSEDDVMVVYPFLPLGQAVDSAPPRKQVFYTCADFRQRAPGWSRPYPDMAGTGMMITVSHPVFDNGNLLGVASRDITLRQISDRALKSLAACPGAMALIIDRRGLAIAASDPDLAGEIEQVNTAAGQAVLHYRTPTGLKDIGPGSARTSACHRINAIVEQVLVTADGAPGTSRLTVAGDAVLAAPVQTTGWLVVLIRPVDGP